MRIVFVFLFTILLSSSLVAQKNYSTKNAEVHFIAVDDSDIDAVNKNAICRLQSNGDMSFIMLIKDFTFEMEGMQKHFNEEYLESDQFPRAFFNGKIANFSTVNFAKDGKYPITVTGTMQVHGVNKAMQTSGMIEIKNGLPIATAKFTVTLKDFKIGGILIKMVADKINIDISATFL
ncbi:MAG: YceI family protein [Chitinophagaceae bacterium]|nr:YceI family protein [Chitinophagaceae bacterium]